jgi:hypothetical protein
VVGGALLQTVEEVQKEKQRKAGKHKKTAKIGKFLKQK